MFKFWLKFNRFHAVAAVVLTGLIASLFARTQVWRRPRRDFPSARTYYEVEVMLHPEDQTISGQAKVDFVASSRGERWWWNCIRT